MSGVVHVIAALERGGSQRTVLDTAVALHRPARPHRLVVGGHRGALDDEAQQALGPRLVRVPSLVPQIAPLHDAAALVACARLLAAAARCGPVVVHTHSSKAGIVGRLAGRSVRGVRVVHTVHGFGVDALGPRGRPFLLGAERVAAQATDVFVFVSAADRERAAAWGLLEGKRSLLIRSGIDDARFVRAGTDRAARASARAAWGVRDDEPLLLTIGNLKPQKDPLLHVEILAAWRARAPTGRLLFLGDGPLRDAVIARASTLGVADALLLPGFVEDPTPALAAADGFLLASAWEGLPRAVLEACAAGLPVVVKDTGWAADVAFIDGLRALAPDAAPAAYAAALPTAPQPQRRGRPLPRAFTLAGMLSDLDALYDELLGPRDG